jgi:hypothetical protein
MTGRTELLTADLPEADAPVTAPWPTPGEWAPLVAARDDEEEAAPEDEEAEDEDDDEDEDDFDDLDDDDLDEDDFDDLDDDEWLGLPLRAALALLHVLPYLGFSR